MQRFPSSEEGSRFQVSSTEIRRAKATTVADEDSIGNRLKAWPDRTKGFLDEVNAEMKKVNYPARKEVQATTTVVIITVFVFAAFFYVVDTVIQFGLSHLLKAFH
jgi:preprotein translocase subunit SecE